MVVLKYRSGNDFEIEDNLADIIEDWICHQIPESFTSAYDKSTGPVITNSSAATVTGVTRLLLGLFRKNGRVKVSKELAKARADICRVCPQNKKDAACLSCQGLAHWVRGWVKGPAENEEKLFVCRACAIMNIAQIYVPINVIKPLMNEVMMESHDPDCWKVKELSDEA